MIDELLDIKEGESVDELRGRLARVLGREEPVPLGAFLRATEDPSYCSYLLTSRGAPGFLEPLLNDPANARYVPAEAAPAAHSNAALAGRAAKALVNWGRAGFSVADEATIERREAACLACPHLSEPATKLQKVLPAKAVADRAGRRTGAKVCNQCGCQVAKKIRVPTEQCPADDPARAGVSRWGERRRSPAEMQPALTEVTP
jgi:hypothetical protein